MADRLIKHNFLAWPPWVFLGCFCFCISFNGQSQEIPERHSAKLDSLYAELDLLFGEQDSLSSLFELADSILLADKIKFHALMARFSYMGQVSSAGRIQDIDQFGLSSGLSYFHPTGAYVDINGFFNSGYEPAYFLSALSFGYFQTFYKYWNINFNHDFFIYNDTVSSQPFNKSLNLSNFFSFKYWESGVDYSLLYGESSAHRVSFFLNGKMKWRFNNSWLKSLTVLPGAGVQWGNADVIYWRQSDSPVLDLFEIIQQPPYPKLTRGQYLYLANLLAEERYLTANVLLRRNNFSQTEIEEIVRAYDESQIESANVFGLMNYSINLPVSLNFGKFGFMLNYTHNFPVALPNELYEYDDNGFLSASISYFLIKPTGLKKLPFTID
ncbi:hypothetical protein C9994_00435 [Marivirga lumbricoides]|uniref:Uncharacterized protein n=1 Tax=Marivirga lumbricoides TaxID=1046115 RepID=A0A2T4DVY0_9BACT|nr:hypothetical protein C9994_00435 [Marivirga lumbricoides]